MAFPRLPFDRILVVLFGLAAPLAAAIPRAMPVWLIAAALVSLAGLVAARGLLGAIRDVRWSIPAGLVAALVGLIAVSAFWSPSPRAGLTAIDVVYAALGAVLACDAVRRLDPDTARAAGFGFLAGFAAAAGIVAINAVFDFPINHWIAGGPEANLDGNVGKRSAAALALMVWPAALLAGVASRREWVMWSGAIACVLGAWPTDSRSAQAGLLAGLLVGALVRAAPEVTRRGLAILFVSVFLGSVPLAGYVASRTGLADADWLFTSARHRVEIWGRAASRIPDAPFFGHGVDAARAMAPRAGEFSRFEPLKDTLFPLHPHNGFLQVWLELGLAGVGLTLAAGLRLLSATAPLAPPIRAPVLALFVTGLFLANTAYGLWQAWWMGAVVGTAAATALAVRIARNG